MTDNPTGPDLSALRALLARAHDEVANIAEGKRRWTMSVPAKPETDSDLLISSALTGAEKALDALAAAREELAEAKREVFTLTNSEAAEIAFAQTERDAARAEADRLRTLVQDLADRAELWPFGKDGHLWQTHEKRDFARWLHEQLSAPADAPQVCVHTHCQLGQHETVNVAEATAPIAVTHGGLVAAPATAPHCGLCGSEDCPGTPGQGCMPGPFETYEPVPVDTGNEEHACPRCEGLDGTHLVRDCRPETCCPDCRHPWSWHDATRCGADCPCRREVPAA